VSEIDEKLRYPIGKFDYQGPVDQTQRNAWITQIAALPGQLEGALAGLSDTQIETPYRPGGWTVRQVVHHVADSHVNAYVRFRLALTENNPTIKAYDEKQWAELIDARSGPTAVSLDLLKAIHKRWVMVLETLEQQQWARTFHHTEYGDFTLERQLALYAWHGRHHVGHINSVRERMGW
jgi:hypothetical protein